MAPIVETSEDKVNKRADMGKVGDIGWLMQGKTSHRDVNCFPPPYDSTGSTNWLIHDTIETAELSVLFMLCRERREKYPYGVHHIPAGMAHKSGRNKMASRICALTNGDPS